MRINNWCVLCVWVCVHADASVHMLVMVFDDDGLRASVHACLRGHQHSCVDVKLRLLHILAWSSTPRCVTEEIFPSVHPCVRNVSLQEVIRTMLA